MDEMMIERLSCAEDRLWSQYSLGGMYEVDPFEDLEDEEAEEDYWEDWAMDLAIDMEREG